MAFLKSWACMVEKLISLIKMASSLHVFVIPGREEPLYWPPTLPVLHPWGWSYTSQKKTTGERAFYGLPQRLSACQLVLLEAYLWNFLKLFFLLILMLIISCGSSDSRLTSSISPELGCEHFSSTTVCLMIKPLSDFYVWALELNLTQPLLWV